MIRVFGGCLVGDDVIMDDFHMWLHGWLEILHMVIYQVTMVTKLAWGLLTQELLHAEMHIGLPCEVSIIVV
jgi:hypothetical protein